METKKIFYGRCKQGTKYKKKRSSSEIIDQREIIESLFFKKFLIMGTWAFDIHVLRHSRETFFWWSWQFFSKQMNIDSNILYAISSLQIYRYYDLDVVMIYELQHV